MTLALLYAPACKVGSGEVEITPVKLARGEFKSLAWGGAQVERFHVVARRGEQNDAVIWSPDHGDTCNLGPVAWYGAMQPLRSGGVAWGALGKGVVLFVDSFDDNGRGTLRFAGIDCRPLSLQIPDVKRTELWTIYDASRAKPTYVARTFDQRLLLADPWQNEQILAAKDVTAVVPIDQGLWLVEGGQVVMRDIAAKQLVRLGHDVRELLVMGEQRIAYVDSTGLSVFSSSTGVKHIADDACNPRTLDGFPLGTLAYFSPCAARRLVIDDGHGRVRTVDEGVVELDSDSGWLAYTRKTASATGLWISNSKPDQAATQVAERDTLALDRMWLRAPNKLLVSIAQSDNLLELWEVDTKLGSANPLEQDLASIRIGVDTFITVDASGTLTLRRMRDRRVEHLAHGVAAAGVRWMFGESSPAIGYLADIDPDSKLGRLEIHFVDSGAHHHVASSVREFREVWWPETGVVYATGPGKDEGLWFARVDVPCEKTTNSPWACVF